MVVDMVSVDMIRPMRKGDILAEKYPMRMFGPLMLAWVTWFLNSETYWSRGGICSVLLEDHLFGGEPGNSSSSDVPLLEVLNLATKFEYVPRVMVPVASMEFSWKVAAQVRADPLVI